LQNLRNNLSTIVDIAEILLSKFYIDILQEIILDSIMVVPEITSDAQKKACHASIKMYCMVSETAIKHKIGFF